MIMKGEKLTNQACQVVNIELIVNWNLEKTRQRRGC